MQDEVGVFARRVVARLNVGGGSADLRLSCGHTVHVEQHIELTMKVTMFPCVHCLNKYMDAREAQPAQGWTRQFESLGSHLTNRPY